MKNLLLLLLFTICIGLLIFIGASISDVPVKQDKSSQQSIVPYLGSIELLNGCGIDGAAQDVADYLRSQSFDVKNIGNAPAWNYSNTLVISRSLDTTMAVRVATALKTDKIAVIRNDQSLYNVTVYIGSDYKERIQ
jgi:hypothetical protein